MKDQWCKIWDEEFDRLLSEGVDVAEAADRASDAADEKLPDVQATLADLALGLWWEQGA